MFVAGELWWVCHPIIKGLTPPQNTTALPFPSDVEIRTLHRVQPRFELYFGPNTAEFTSRVGENTTYQSHQTARKQKRRPGSIRQTLPLVTAFSFNAYHNTGKGGRVYTVISAL